MKNIEAIKEAPAVTAAEAQNPETASVQPTSIQTTEIAPPESHVKSDSRDAQSQSTSDTAQKLPETEGLDHAISQNATITPVAVHTDAAAGTHPTPTVAIPTAVEVKKEQAAEPSSEKVMSTFVKLDKILEKENAELAKPMTEQEKRRRDENVSMIVKAGSDMMLASLALKEIRDKRLYREGHDTFEAFCKDVCEITAARASQLISAAKDYTALKDKVDGKLLPKTEAAFRQLRAVHEDYKVDVLELAVQLSDQNRPTGAAIQQAWQKLKEQKGEAAGAKKTKKVKPGKVLKQTQAAVAMLKTADKKTFTIGELSELKSVFKAFTDAAEAIAKE